MKHLQCKLFNNVPIVVVDLKVTNLEYRLSGAKIFQDQESTIAFTVTAVNEPGQPGNLQHKVQGVKKNYPLPKIGADFGQQLSEMSHYWCKNSKLYDTIIICSKLNRQILRAPIVKEGIGIMFFLY